MSLEEWKKVKLKDVIIFNPKETIKKGKSSKKVAMDKLEPFTRKITGFEEVEFTSGTKFRNGDTLLARITPCLENGKTAQVDILNKNEVGFGSTEYIVLREKINTTDNDFIYYMSISPEFRNVAIKAMNGSSGRQRVQKDVLENSEFMLPPIVEQRAIAKVLSVLDKKIEINNQINDNLEKMAQSIFKQWFVDFEFPNEYGEPYKSSGGKMVESELGRIPKGWKAKELRAMIKFIKGKKPKTILENEFENSVKYLTIDALNGNTVQFAVNDKVILANKNDTLMVMDGASSGTLYYGMDGIVGSTLAKIVVNDEAISQELLYYFLKNNEINIKAHLTGSAIPHTDKEFVNRLVISIPDDKKLVEEITNILSEIRNKVIICSQEIKKINEIKDILLPKLMSGEIRVPLEN